MIADKPLHLLIIDDDEINNFIVTRIIAKIPNINAKVDTCLNGQAGIELLNSLKDDVSSLPDIIFLDINMPVMNGWEFLNEYERMRKTLGKNIKIFMLSSSVYNDDINLAKNYTAVNSFISKPLSLEKIQGIYEDFYKTIQA